MRISVFGLGYVGSVTAACLARNGHHVIGVDVNPLKVERINQGEAPFVEPELDPLLLEGRDAGRLKATCDASEAVLDTSLSLICVGTPSQKNHDLDLTYVKKVAEDIGRVMKGKEERHLVAVRSTVLPGSTMNVVVPSIEKASHKKVHRDFGICYNPEFLREGSAVHDFHHPPKTVIGECHAEDGEVLGSMYEGIPAPLLRTGIPEAEMVKYVDNAFHALKVAFANEVGRICKAHQIDSHQVMSLFCKDTKLNISGNYLKPGFAFGGSCLPKDLRALVYRARQRDLPVPLLAAVQESNREQVRIALERIMETGKKKIGFLGLSFKGDTDDLRESPLVDVVEALLGKGYGVMIYDRNVSLSRIHGANREYMETHLPHLASLLTDTLDEVLSHAEVIVIGNHAKSHEKALRRARPDQILIDLIRITRNPNTKAAYDGLSW